MDPRRLQLRSLSARIGRRRRSAALFLVLIIVTVLGLAAASLSRLSIAQMRYNEQHRLWLEARAAAETAVDFGVAQLRLRWAERTAFPSGELLPGNQPLRRPDEMLALYEGTRVVGDSLAIVGTEVSDGRWMYIDADDPANFRDPQRGKLVFVREVRVLGRARALDEGRGMEQVAYAQQVLQVRDAPLFTHAIFYNMDLEFHPGPSMDMLGPVHSNADIWVQCVSGLRFHDGMTATGDIFHGTKFDGGRHQVGPVEIKGPEGRWVEMYKGGGRWNDSSYVDSRMGEKWRETATDRWDGNVKSGDHDVPRLDVVAIDGYVEDDVDTPQDETENHGYALIEPQLPNTHPGYKGRDVQRVQYSYKAGLVLKVEENTGGGGPEEGKSEDDGDGPKKDVPGKAKGHDKDKAKGKAKGHDRGGEGEEDEAGSGASPPTYRLQFYRYEREEPDNPNSEPLLNADGTPRLVPLDMDGLPEDLVKVTEYAESDGKPVEGTLWDERERTGYGLVEVDVEKLRATLDAAAPDYDASAWNDSYHVSGARRDWNGVLYVEVPYENSASSRPDRAVKATGEFAVRLVNGKHLPSPSNAVDAGFTVATNAPLYVKGHYNADGKFSWSGAYRPDIDAKIPASLAGDAITILSDKFDDTKSKLHRKHRKARFTEVSAAIVTGLYATRDNWYEMSGGAHNLMRFLEHWSGKRFTYRGSLVALYESEVASAPFDQIRHPDWYSPPLRHWGFNEIFKEGNFPPGTLFARDFRRIHTRFLSADEYAENLPDSYAE